MDNNIQLCIFAYNLEDCIAGNLRSLVQSCGDYVVSVYVMINGCRDNTGKQVERLSREYPRIKPVYIQLGDKANAWNQFIYQYYESDAIAVFADGDLTFADHAIANIIDYYYAHPQYNSISGFPCLNGRSSERWRKNLLKQHQFTGNLYLLSPVFLNRILEEQVRLPIGLIGDDSMLGYLSATNICSPHDTPIKNIGVCTSSIFNYDSLNPFKPKDIKLYFRRCIRYSKRYFQQNYIVPILKREGIRAMPEHAWDIKRFKIRWLSTSFIFDVIAFLSIKKEFYNLKYTKNGKV